MLVRADPTGTISSIVGGPGRVVISGTISDPAADTDPRIAVSIDGGTPTVLVTSSGSYRVAVPAPAGEQQVAVTYLGSGEETEVSEGSYPVDVAGTVALWQRERLVAVAAGVLGLLVLVSAAVVVRRARRRHAA